MNRRIRKLLLVVAMTLTVLPIFKSSIIKVEAKTTYTYYNFACPAYEVDTISDSGTFVLSSCQSSFDAAKSAMYAAGNDAVVRDRNAYSANQIIAMTRGYAYSYSVRAGRYTLVITQNTTGYDVKSTYINNLRPMLYKDTISYNGDGTGKVLVNAYGFEGTADLIQVDLVPSKFLNWGFAIWMGGNDITPNPDHEWQVMLRRPYYTAEKNGNYTDLVYYCYSSVPDSGGWAQDITYNGLNVGVAPSWMEVGKKYYSWNDSDFYSDPELKNYVNTYYNYYQFVSYRTKSKIPASVYNSFLSNAGRNSSSKLWDMGNVFIADQDKYGINAAMTFVQACDESAYGTSNYALNRNNLFGVAAYDSNPDNASDFDSPAAAIDYQMSLMLMHYGNTNYAVFFGDHFGNKGSGITVKYASSNYYGLVLSSIYYNLDKFANNYSGSLTDFQSNCIGIVKDQKTNVYSSPNSSSSVLYTTEYGPTYQKDFTLSILAAVGDYYKVQSTDYVANGAQIDVPVGATQTYDWTNMVGYIKKSDIKYICGTVPNIPVSSVTLSSAAATLAPGSTRQLTATLAPSDATNKNISWKSSDANVASVDSNGLVTAKNTGVATITAISEDGNHSASCNVTVTNGTELEGFVTSLYENILDREPESSGLNYWLYQLREGGMTGAQVVSTFISGAEFTNKNYCNEHYIIHLYRAILSREPEPSGLAYWMMKMSGGESREEVLNAFLTGTEFGNLCAEYGIVRGNAIPLPAQGTIQTWTCVEDGKMDNEVGQFVLRMYTECLSRDGERWGVGYWIYMLRTAGYSGSQAAHDFFFGAEFTNRNYSNEEYITRLYRTLLDRDPEPYGFGYWKIMMNTFGMSREAVFRQFISGTEWNNVCNSYGIKK